MLLPPTELDDNPTPPAPFQNEEEDPVLLQKLAAFAIVPTTAEEEAIKNKTPIYRSSNLSIYQITSYLVLRLPNLLQSLSKTKPSRSRREQTNKQTNRNGETIND